MKTIRIVTLVLLSLNVTARQGMWMPNLLKQLNAEDLKSMGLSIPVDELFSANGGALNDAIVQFGGGCTGEVISDSGLILTNHHCGYGQLQSLSTLVNNYVRDGFWAKNRLEELPCPGLTVTFVRDIRPVTQVFMDAGIGKLDEGEREKKVKLISDSLEQLFSSGGKLNVFVKAFYNGNQYFLFVTEVFRDVRLVGAPPSDIGNYGGETDNWVWPRHTGDFTVFRIYAGSDNGPADYSTENRPYRPGRSLVINAGGIKEGDFTMVYGFPGRTQQFLPSSSIRMIQTQTNPNRIALRELRMAVWKESMRSNDTIQLKYASKFRSLANAYKKWKGESEGLEKSDAIAKKQAAEVAFKSWANSNPDYRTVIDEINAAVDSSFVTNQVSDYFSEGLNGIELISMANKIRPLMEKWEKSRKDTAGLRVIAAKVSGDISALYKNYDARVDRMACEKILNVCSGNLSGKYRPAFLDVFQKAPDAYLDLLFKKSIFTDESKALASVNDFSNSGMKRLASDPAWKAAEAIIRCRTENIEPEFNRLNTRINQLQRLYTAGQLAMKQDVPTAPDANSTLRVSYGKVEGMRPLDGIKYDYFTTVAGIIEKSKTTEQEYALPFDLVGVMQKSTGSSYADKDGMHVAFLASNHTTGGNSGSPVLDHKGRLIGINFDRIWEGVMSDLYYYDRFSRNISVDIRYVLFVIEEVGNASWILKEMRIEK